LSKQWNMRWRWIGSAGWGLLFLLGLSGTPGARAASYPDMLGRSVAVPDRPLRLVTLAPSLTEIVFALDRGEWVAGVSAACDHPAPARSRPKVGGIAAPNLEQIARLAPDLIFASAEANTRETLSRLDRLGLPVFAVKPAGFEGILESIRLMGAVLRAEHTERLTQSIRDRAVAAAARVASRGRPRVLYLIWTDPPIAVGPAAFIHDLLTLAGGTNVVKEPSARYLALGWEEIVARQPEVILIAAHEGAGPGGRSTEENRAVWGGWQSLPAVRAGRVVSLPGDTILRPGPRVAEGVERLARAIHPDAFAARRSP